jgi:hypothetical protein
VDDATEHGWELTVAWPRRELQRVPGLLERRKDPGEQAAGRLHQPTLTSAFKDL